MCAASNCSWDTAGIALFNVAAQCCRSTLLNGAHDAALPPAECGRVLRTIGRAALAKDVRHLQPGRAQGQSSEMSCHAGHRLWRVNLWQ